MFKPPSDNHHGAPPRPSAGDTARLRATLTQIIVTHLSPPSFQMFVNDRAIDPLTIEQVYIRIAAPTDDDQVGSVQAQLNHRVAGVDGGDESREYELFPGTFELVAVGRRIAVTCRSTASLDGTWIDLGLKPDGTGHEVTGAQELVLVIDNDLVEAKLTWNDGVVEDLLPAMVDEA